MSWWLGLAGWVAASVVLSLALGRVLQRIGTGDDVAPPPFVDTDAFTSGDSAPPGTSHET